MPKEHTEIAIVGGGPAGLATAYALEQAGHSVVVLEQGPIAAHVSQFPTFMKFFSTPDLLELGGFPLITTHEKPSRQEYLNYLRRFVLEKKLDVRTGKRVDGLEGEKGNFRLFGEDRCGEAFELGAAIVVLATGAFASPHLLGIPGETLPKVSHYYTELHPYFGSKVLIIGGRNSAAETALELWRGGVDVTICHRREDFGSLKYWVRPDIENRVANGEVKAYMSACVLEVKPGSVLLQAEGEEPKEIENDFVIALTGHGPDPEFLSKFGVQTRPDTGRPRFNPDTLETERPGLYMVGVMLQGDVSGEIFIENSRTHGDQICDHLVGSSNGNANGPIEKA